MRNQNLEYRIYLKASKISGLHELFHKFFENFVFFRWMFFKNRPRSTFLLIRAFLITATFCSLYYMTISRFKFIVMGVDVDPILIFSFMGVLGYWSMLKSFYEKNNYCSQLYNEIIKEKARGHLKSSKILAVNLSIQLLSMDLWSHRIYSALFVQMLEEAIDHSFDDNSYFKTNCESKEQLYKLANDRKLEVGVARNLLHSYQYQLEDSI